MGKDERVEENKNLTIEKLLETCYEIEQKFTKIPDELRMNYSTECKLKSYSEIFKYVDTPHKTIKYIGSLKFIGIPITINNLIPANRILCMRRNEVLQIIDL